MVTASAGLAVGGWAASQVAATNFASSLVYVDLAGNALATDGGKLAIGYPFGQATSTQPSRNWALGGLNAAGTTYNGLLGVGSADAAAVGEGTAVYWVSFLMKWTTTNVNADGYGGNTAPPYFTRKVDVVLRTGSTGTNNYSTGIEAADFGSPSTNALYGKWSARQGEEYYDKWALWNNGDAGAGTNLYSTVYTVTNTTLVLAKLVIDTNLTTADQVYLWLNWTNLTVSPDTAGTRPADATNTYANLTGLNNIRIDVNSANGVGTNAYVLFDEFRIGNAFADVVPVMSISPQAPVLSSTYVGGVFELQVAGGVGPTYFIQGSTNLVNWDELYTTNPVAMPFSWNDPTTSNFSRRFYRVYYSP